MPVVQPLLELLYLGPVPHNFIQSLWFVLLGPKLSVLGRVEEEAPLEISFRNLIYFKRAFFRLGFLLLDLINFRRRIVLEELSDGRCLVFVDVMNDVEPSLLKEKGINVRRGYDLDVPLPGVPALLSLTHRSCQLPLEVVDHEGPLHEEVNLFS